jgi:hypothetical protein
MWCIIKPKQHRLVDDENQKNIRMQPLMMEMIKTFENNHQWCKLNDEHDKRQHTQTWQCKIK